MSFHACTALKRPNPACSDLPHFEASDLPDISALQLLDDDWNNSDGGKFDWEWASEVASCRAEEEGWTYNDCVAALFQGSLLGYSSDPKSSEVFGERYVLSAPEHYLHNAPWNDWTPPSKSRQRFEKAQANKQPELVEKRVRVHICASPDAAGQRNRVIAFASVEMIAGKKCLQFRRGSAILAAMAVSSLQVTCIGDRMMVLAPRPHSKLATSPVVFLSFEDQARASKFSNLFV